MALNYERIMAYRPADIAVSYGARDCILYALGIGIGMDPLDPGALRFVYERADLQAFPTMAVVLGWPGRMTDPAFGVDERLVVEARVLPDDIDVVWAGRDARVRLTAYKARSHLTLVGKVTQVSGSTFRDEGSQGRPYYKARVEIDGDELQKVERGLLIPGMLAQVEIAAGERSAMRYLFDPILDSMRRAFKES